MVGAIGVVNMGESLDHAKEKSAYEKSLVNRLGFGGVLNCESVLSLSHSGLYTLRL